MPGPLVSATLLSAALIAGMAPRGALGADHRETEARRLMASGQRFEHGIGAPQNIDRAVALYCKASGLGLAEAQYHLGWLYATGRVGEIDEVLAAAWFKAALSARHQRAEQQLEDLGALDMDLGQSPQCVLSAAMVARRIPTERGRGPAAPDPDLAPPSLAVREVGRADIVSLVTRLAPDYRLDPELVLAVIKVESNFDPTARSEKQAQGLMQLIPETAERFGVTNVWDPVDNLRGGMAYLRWLLDHFDGDLELALAGYNAGENAVARFGGVPPYPETRGYVKRIEQILGARAADIPVSVLRGAGLASQVAADGI